MHCGAVGFGSHGAHGNQFCQFYVVELGSSFPCAAWECQLDALHPLFTMQTRMLVKIIAYVFLSNYCKHKRTQI